MSVAFDPSPAIQAFFALLDCATLVVGPASHHPAVLLLAWFGL